VDGQVSLWRLLEGLRTGFGRVLGVLTLGGWWPELPVWKVCVKASLVEELESGCVWHVVVHGWYMMCLGCLWECPG
jgi:hypothetical protein